MLNAVRSLVKVMYSTLREVYINFESREKRKARVIKLAGIEQEYTQHIR